MEKALHERSTIEFSIKGLKPRTMYRLYAVAHHNQSADKMAIRMNDRAIENTLQRFRTVDAPPEILDLEWSRMDCESRYDELLAARYDTGVQKAAIAAGIKIPTPEMLEEWLDEQDLSGSEEDVSKSGSDDEDKENEDEDEKVRNPCPRADVVLLTSFHLQERKIGKKVVKDFVEWWIDGDEVYGYSPVSGAKSRNAIHINLRGVCAGT